MKIVLNLILSIIFMFVAISCKTHHRKNNTITNIHKMEIQKNSSCDSLKIMVSQNWQYVENGDYYQKGSAFSMEYVSTWIYYEQYEDCLKNMNQSDFINLLGKPHEISEKALVYYLGAGGERRRSSFLRIVFENKKLFAIISF